MQHQILQAWDDEIDLHSTLYKTPTLDLFRESTNVWNYNRTFWELWTSKAKHLYIHLYSLVLVPSKEYKMNHKSAVGLKDAKYAKWRKITQNAKFGLKNAKFGLKNAKYGLKNAKWRKNSN